MNNKLLNEVLEGRHSGNVAQESPDRVSDSRRSQTAEKAMKLLLSAVKELSPADLKKLIEAMQTIILKYLNEFK